jgi:hypothetical protein
MEGPAPRYGVPFRLSRDGEHLGEFYTPDAAEAEAEQLARMSGWPIVDWDYRTDITVGVTEGPTPARYVIQQVR